MASSSMAGSVAGQALSVVVAFFLPCMLVLVQRRAETMVVALCFAFGWLVGIGLAGVAFVSGLTSDRLVLSGVLAAAGSELGRFAVYRGYRYVERLDLAAEVRLDDASSSLAAGFGTAALHAVFLFAAAPAPSAAHAAAVLMFVVLDVALAGLLFCEPRPAPPNHPDRGGPLVLLERFFFDSRHAPALKLLAAVGLHAAATLASSLGARAALPGVALCPAAASLLAFRGRTRVYPLVSARGGFASRVLRSSDGHT